MYAHRPNNKIRIWPYRCLGFCPLDTVAELNVEGSIFCYLDSALRISRRIDANNTVAIVPNFKVEVREQEVLKLIVPKCDFFNFSHKSPDRQVVKEHLQQYHWHREGLKKAP